MDFHTLSKSEQQTPGRTPEESGINGGNWYNSTYDKLHNVAVTGSYNLNEMVFRLTLHFKLDNR
jgi:hypothetical protein